MEMHAFLSRMTQYSAYGNLYLVLIITRKLFFTANAAVVTQAYFIIISVAQLSGEGGFKNYSKALNLHVCTGVILCPCYISIYNRMISIT